MTAGFPPNVPSGNVGTARRPASKAVALIRAGVRAVALLIPPSIHPNWLSIIRALLVVPVVLYANAPRWAIFYISLASVFDILDGEHARARGLKSALGAFLDQFGDKVFINVALWFACGDRVELWVRIAILSIDGLLLLARLVEHLWDLALDSNAWGALKTWMQTIAIGCALFQENWSTTLSRYVFWFGIFCAAASLWLHIRGIRRGIQKLRAPASTPAVSTLGASASSNIEAA